MLAVVIMFSIRYDIAPVLGNWSMPKTHKTSLAAVVLEPHSDIEVEATPRKGYEVGHWAFSLKDSGKIRIASGVALSLSRSGMRFKF